MRTRDWRNWRTSPPANPIFALLGSLSWDRLAFIFSSENTVICISNDYMIRSWEESSMGIDIELILSVGRMCWRDWKLKKGKGKTSFLRLPGIEPYSNLQNRSKRGQGGCDPTDQTLHRRWRLNAITMCPAEPREGTQEKSPNPKIIFKLPKVRPQKKAKWFVRNESYKAYNGGSREKTLISLDLEGRVTSSSSTESPLWQNQRMLTRPQWGSAPR